MRIVVTNDDGFESANLQALFTALRVAGHDVILSAPYRNVSGESAELGGLSDVPRTIVPSAGGLLPAGSPGVGPTTIAADQFYVDSTSVAAVLYGIDIAAQAKWGAGPDLVVSGPNIGNNLGVMIPHSGTVGAAITVLNRGIPAIAVSGANGDAATAPLLAAITLRVIAALDNNGHIALPPGIGLNVNVPALDRTRGAASYRFAFTQVGSGANAGIRFSLHLTDRPTASTASLPADNNPASEGNAFADGNTVTVSPIQGTFQAPPDQSALVAVEMRGLFGPTLPLLNPKLINVSARGVVGATGAAQIVGFVVAGTAAKTVLIRASGPALAAFGVASPLADPAIELFDRNNRLVGANDNWGDDAAKAAAIAAAAARVGAFAWPAGSKDDALLVTLAPGPYTVVARGTADATGVTLVEVYDASVD